MTTVQKKEKGLQKYSFRGYTPEQIDQLTTEQVVELFRARQRRRFARKIKHRYNRFYMKCKKSKKQCQPGEKPSTVKTHLRNCIVMPEMVGNIVGVYNGKVFNPVEVKFDMIGRYLGEFSLSYKPTRHGKAGVGATKGSAHSSLK
jgi:small subunit ribosomal protein S15e